MKFKWDERMEKQMRALLRKGYNADTAAVEMGRTGVQVSPNAIVGKCYRLGLPFPGRSQKPKPPPKPKPVVVVRASPPPLPILKSGSRCQYILGEASDREFCGQPVVANPFSRAGFASWCEAHLKVVFQKPKPYRGPDRPSRIRRQ